MYESTVRDTEKLVSTRLSQCNSIASRELDLVPDIRCTQVYRIPHICNCYIRKTHKSYIYIHFRFSQNLLFEHCNGYVYQYIALPLRRARAIRSPRAARATYDSGSLHDPDDDGRYRRGGGCSRSRRNAQRGWVAPRGTDSRQERGRRRRRSRCTSKVSLRARSNLLVSRSHY